MTPAPPPTTAWHAGDDLLDRYAAGTTTPSQALSVEAHMLGCPQCQAHLSAAVPSLTVDRSWEAVADRIDRSTSLVDRLVDHLGLPDGDGTVVAAAARLHGSWAAAVLGILIASLVVTGAGRDGTSEAAYLVLAPMLPLLGVAVAYGPRTDPAWELSHTTPMPRLRLLLVRTAALLAVTLPLAGATGVATGAGPAVAAALLPGLALAAIALALGTRVVPLTTATALGPAWIIVVGASLLVPRGNVVDALDATALYQPAVQAAFGLVAVGALAFTLLRSNAFDRREDLT